MKIDQISSASFLRPGAWVATVTSINIIVLNGFVSFLFYFAANI